jgi:hypothetical protein
MVGRNVFRMMLVVVAVSGARSAMADPITFTGNVSTDFGITTPGQSTNTNVTVVSTSSSLNPSISTGTGGTTLYNDVSPGDAIKQVAFSYDAANNTAYVGVQTWGVAGNVSNSTIANGNGMVVGFESLNGQTYNPINLTAPTFVAGTANIGSGQTAAEAGRGSGLDGFNVATYTGGTVPGTMNLLAGFGTTLSTGMGNLAFSPSTTTPDYEFSIANFSQVLGASPNKGVVLMVQDGQINIDTSKDEIVGVGLQPQVIPPNTPEPSTVVIWVGLAGGMAWGYRRRSRRSPA